jgi:hypothetical protein
MSVSPESTAVEVLPERRLTAVPTPIRKRALDLATLTDVRREMSRVYREVRFKKMPPEVGAKLTFMLTSIAKITELAEVQPRVEAIERVLARRPCS